MGHETIGYALCLRHDRHEGNPSPLTAEMSGGGEVVAKRPKVSADNAATGADDLLSALPDDVLVLILLHLSTEQAARTSALARRWRRVWTLLPEIRFNCVRDPRCVPSTLAASKVPLRSLLVAYVEPSAESLAEWLPAATGRVSGELILVNLGTASDDGEDDEAASSPLPGNTFELPCFEKATTIGINLGPLGFSVPPAGGVFARLTDLYLSEGRFHGPGDLGDAVSSPRCPCLLKLIIRNVRGLDAITIRSDSLQELELRSLRGVRRVIVVAPALKGFSLLQCFLDGRNQQVVSVSAPQLQMLKWVDAYDPTSVQLDLATNMDHLRTMATCFYVYGPDALFTYNRACLDLLPRFKTIQHLILPLVYLQEVHNLQYIMEDMTTLPHVESLHLIVMAEGHAFGACSFHVLRICSGIKHLMLVFSNPADSQKPSACSSDCICDQPSNWKTEDISLNHLQELEIEGFRGSDHEVAFVKRLPTWVPVLKMVTVTFHCSVNETKARELFQMFRGFSRPGVRMKFFVCQESRTVAFAPEG